MNVRFLAAVLVFGGFALLASRHDAGADPATCVSLETRLAELEQSANDYWDGADSSAIDQAIAEGRSELDRAMMQAQRSGCQGGFRTPGARCGRIMASVERLSANLNRLYRQRQQTAVDPYAAERERSRVLRALADNQCGDGYQDNSAARRSNGFFATLFGRRPFGADSESEGSPSVLNFGYTTFRTLCVRTCDGYYFPISFATVPERFAKDEQTCQAACPASEVHLYVHGNPGEEASAMVSLAGQPYTALPSAFRFRRQFDASCTCHLATAGATAALGSPPPGPAGLKPLHPVATVPPSPAAPDPNRAEDPETIANRAGSFGVAAVPSAISPPRAVAGNSTTGKPVRVVGPNYYVAQ